LHRPEFALAWRHRGNCHYEQGNYAQAAADFSAAIRINPLEAGAYHSRGLANFAQGESRQAEADLAEAIRLDPRYADGELKHRLDEQVQSSSSYVRRRVQGSTWVWPATKIMRWPKRRPPKRNCAANR
jgi:tetratricopeptide (TPR) repeat protein